MVTNSCVRPEARLGVAWWRADWETGKPAGPGDGDPSSQQTLVQHPFTARKSPAEHTRGDPSFRPQGRTESRGHFSRLHGNPAPCVRAWCAFTGNFTGAGLSVKLPGILAETAAAPSGGVPLTGPQVPVLIKHVCPRMGSEKTQDRTPLAVQRLGPCFHCRGRKFGPWLGN